MVKIDTCRKNKVLGLDPEQKAILRRWFGVARKYYNETIAYFQINDYTSDCRHIIEDRLNAIDYCQEVPLKIRQVAITDASKAIQNAIKKFQETQVFQCCSFRKKKQPSQSINIDSSAIKIDKEDARKFSIYVTRLKPMRMREELKVFGACRLTMKHGRIFYLSSPQPMSSIDNQDCFEWSAASIDPGVRNAFTVYSQHCCMVIGENTMEERFRKLHSEIDLVKSKRAKYWKKLKNPLLRGDERSQLKSHCKRMTVQIQRLYGRCTHLVKELHYKTALFLCRNFKVITIPVYEVKQLQQKASKKVNRENTRLSHYTFRQRLIHTAERHGCKVLVVSEPYTSKTCTGCGREGTPTRDSFTCTSCQMTIERDFQGARNIHIKTYHELEYTLTEMKRELNLKKLQSQN